MLVKDVGVCIRAVDYSETSQVVTFFARDSGKVGAIAKGSKRPKSAFDGPIEVFSHGRIVFSDSGRARLATLTEFEQQAGFVGLRKNLFALNCCLLGAELVGGLTDDFDPHPQLFESLVQFLNDAQGSESKAEMLALLILFELSVLKEAGLGPVIGVCANCKSVLGAGRGQRYFSSSANGLICRDCEVSFPDRIRMSAKAGACLAELKLLGRSGQRELREVEGVLVAHLTELLHYRPKTAKYVLSNCGQAVE